MTHFCAGFTGGEVSTYLNDAGGGEVNFLHVTYASSRFVRVGWRASRFGISLGVSTVVRMLVHPYRVTEFSYPLPVLKCLGLEA